MAIKTINDSTLTAIADAIRAKNGSADTYKPSEMAEAIEAIPTGGSLKTVLDITKSTSDWFNGFSGTSLDGLFSYNDTVSVTDMTKMFYNCRYLLEIPSFDMSSVTVANQMCCNCTSIITVPFLNTNNLRNANNMFVNAYNLITVPSFYTGNVTDLSYLFQNCSNLSSDMVFDTSKATDVRGMFDGCQLLRKVDVSKINITISELVGNMFRNCKSLRCLIVRSGSGADGTTVPSLSTNTFTNCYHLTGTVDATYNPTGAKDCFIYVPDDMLDAWKSATNWSVYASQIKGISELSEESE